MTAAFTHVEIWHLAMNMFALFIFGPALEGIVGRARFLAIYLLSAARRLGHGAVALPRVQPPTVGASGAIFGLLGALLVLARKARLNSQWLVQNLVLGVVITVVGWRYISWQGHLGGLLGGALAAAIIAYAPASRRALVQWVGLAPPAGRPPRRSRSCRTSPSPDACPAGSPAPAPRRTTPRRGRVLRGGEPAVGAVLDIPSCAHRCG